MRIRTITYGMPGTVRRARHARLPDDWEPEIRPTALDLAAGIGPVALALITMQHEKGKQP